ncbi:putative membrane protein [Paraburkholderia sp. BL18I3N2]|uniref:DUF1269 domain-containing protein n=1 Tax=Paraburkholderia sp. BL18I3N2 TaxID=1938799 RepID=UPI000D06BF52|nr:DUF1269 domain-containing protein [Paraburkholderia sp. BL18I3N2]PRX33040.1 putative membrane protein [Paraburkholderia sp. BL18I3N2]
MSTLIAITYQDLAAAEGALKELRTLQGEYLLQLKDAVIVERTADGRVTLHQTFDPTAAGALRGAFWGCLIGWLFLNPLLGAAVGSASGALAGKLSEYGVGDTFVKSLTQKIQPGAAAVFALLKEVTLDKVEADLAKLGGTVLYTNLSLDDELKLVEALSKAKNSTDSDNPDVASSVKQ